MSEELIESIMRVLEIDFQATDVFYPDQTEQIARFRSCGRKAGRRLGWKVRTFQSNPAARSDDRVVVMVVPVAEELPADEQERLRERGDLLIRHAFSKML